MPAFGSDTSLLSVAGADAVVPHRHGQIECAQTTGSAEMSASVAREVWDGCSSVQKALCPVTLEPGALMGRGGLSSVDSVRSDRSGSLTLCDVAFVSSSMFTVFRRVLSTVLSVFV